MSDPLRIGIVGTGAIARKHIDAIDTAADEVRLVAVCEPVAAAADAFLVGLFGDWEGENYLEATQIDTSVAADE